MNRAPMILKTDPGGRPIRWIDVRLAAGYLLRDEIAWASPEIAVALHGGTCARTGLRSRIDIPSIVAVSGARAAFYDATVPRLTNAALFLRDRRLCCYCGEVFDRAEKKVGIFAVERSEDHPHCQFCFDCHNADSFALRDAARARMEGAA
jgi:hypothetical protein